jgi:hypothetical protein
MAMDCTLTEAMCEIELLHRLYNEQERVIKDCDDLIVEIVAEEDNDDDNDSNSGPDYEGDDNGGARDVTVEDPEEVLEGDAPQVQPPVEEVPQEEAPHPVVEPQAAPTPPPSRLPRLYVQLMQDIAKDSSVREESQGSLSIV